MSLPLDELLEFSDELTEAGLLLDEGALLDEGVLLDRGVLLAVDEGARDETALDDREDTWLPGLLELLFAELEFLLPPLLPPPQANNKLQATAVINGIETCR